MSYNMLQLMLILTCATTISITNAHDITSILASHPEFSTFNKYLSLTGLNDEINARKIVTVLAVDNAGMMSDELAAYYINDSTIDKITLRSQVIFDYYLTPPYINIMFGDGSAAGYINNIISVVKDEAGKIVFRSSATDDGLLLESVFVKSVEQISSSSTTTTISVLQVSQLFNSNHRPQARSMAGVGASAGLSLGLNLGVDDPSTP